MSSKWTEYQITYLDLKGGTMEEATITDHSPQFIELHTNPQFQVLSMNRVKSVVVTSIGRFTRMSKAAFTYRRGRNNAI